MTEQEINEKKKQIYAIKDEIRERECAIQKLEGEIKTHYLQEAEAKYPHIKRGDKVVVTSKTWTYNGYITSVSEPLFFAYARYNRFAYELNDSLIELVFKQVKKNGEPSQKETCFYSGSIVKIEKVNE